MLSEYINADEECIEETVIDLYKHPQSMSSRPKNKAQKSHGAFSERCLSLNMPTKPPANACSTPLGGIYGMKIAQNELFNYERVGEKEKSAQIYI